MHSICLQDTLGLLHIQEHLHVGFKPGWPHVCTHPDLYSSLLNRFAKEILLLFFCFLSYLFKEIWERLVLGLLHQGNNCRQKKTLCCVPQSTAINTSLSRMFGPGTQILLWEQEATDFQCNLLRRRYFYFRQIFCLLCFENIPGNTENYLYNLTLVLNSKYSNHFYTSCIKQQFSFWTVYLKEVSILFEWFLLHQLPFWNFWNWKSVDLNFKLTSTHSWI